MKGGCSAGPGTGMEGKAGMSPARGQAKVTGSPVLGVEDFATIATAVRLGQWLSRCVCLLGPCLESGLAAPLGLGCLFWDLLFCFPCWGSCFLSPRPFSFLAYPLVRGAHPPTFKEVRKDRSVAPCPSDDIFSRH